jgi:hypothetical protein
MQRRGKSNKTKVKEEASYDGWGENNRKGNLRRFGIRVTG